jgi:Fibronectin type III domain
MDIGAELKAKAGPFPLYVWLLAMTALAAVAYFLLKKKKAATPATGTPGAACTMADGSAGTWDSSGTVCQATTTSTVNAPSTGGQRTWRTAAGSNSAGSASALAGMAGDTSSTVTSTPVTTAAASTPAAAASTTPPAAPPVSTSTTGPTAPKSVTPAAVTGLHVTSTGTNSIGLAWTKSANATSYQVRVTYQSAVTSTAMTTGTSYTVTGLTANHTYGLHVVAINGSNWAPEASISQKTKS